MPSTATPTILTSPGYLLIAPLGSTLPTNTVAGSVFTDAWDVTWLPLGATEEGRAVGAGVLDPLTAGRAVGVVQDDHGRASGSVGVRETQNRASERANVAARAKYP